MHYTHIFILYFVLYSPSRTGYKLFSVALLHIAVKPATLEWFEQVAECVEHYITPSITFIKPVNKRISLYKGNVGFIAAGS